MNKRLYGLFLAFLIFLGFILCQYYCAYLLGWPEENCIISGIRLYNPFAWVIWYFQAASPIFIWATEKAANAFYFYMFIFATGFIVVGFRNSKLKNTYTHGQAKLITDKELAILGCLDPEGVCLCQTSKAKIKIETGDKLRLIKPGKQIRYHGDSHVLMVAPTGSGKGVGVVIPTHLNWSESIISIDIKKENYEATAGYRRMFSHVIKFEPTSHNSAHYNFLDAVRVGTVNETADVQTIVEMIVDDGEGATGKDPFWDNSAKGFLTGLILFILHSPDIPAENKNIPYLNRLINDPEEDLIDKLSRMAKMDFGDDPVGPAIKTAAVDMLNTFKSEATFASIIKTVTTKLVLYADPVIAANISSSDFSVMDLRNSENPVSLYICISPGDLQRLRPLLRLLLNQFVTLLSQELPKGKYHKILFLIDEFTAMRKMEIFEQAAAYMRGYGVKFFFIIQSFTQINEYYGKDNSIIDNCGVQIFHATNRIEVATDLSNRLGNTTVLVDSMSKSNQKNEGSTSRNTSETAKKLLSPEEIMAFPRDRVILFIEGHSGYIGKKNIYYEDPCFKNRAFLPTPEQLGKETEEYEDLNKNTLTNVKVSPAKPIDEKESETEETMKKISRWNEEGVEQYQEPKIQTEKNNEDETEDDENQSSGGVAQEIIPSEQPRGPRSFSDHIRGLESR